MSVVRRTSMNTGLANGLSPHEKGLAARACVAKYERSRRIMIGLVERIFGLISWAVGLIGWNRGPSSTSETKILVLECGQLGDVALVTPFLRNLRILYQHAQISLAGNPTVLQLLQGETLTDECWAVRIPWGVNGSRWRKYNVFSFA